MDGEPLETWEDWSETDFLAEEGTIESPDRPLSTAVLAEAREVLIAMPKTAATCICTKTKTSPSKIGRRRRLGADA